MNKGIYNFTWWHLKTPPFNLPFLHWVSCREITCGHPIKLWGNTISANPRMTGEPYTAVGTGSTIGPPHVGLSPERIRVLDRQARVRIAKENAEQEVRKAEKAARKAAAKEKKLAARGRLRAENDKGNSRTSEGLKTRWRSFIIRRISNLNLGLIQEEKQEEKGLLGSLKNLPKRNEEEATHVRWEPTVGILLCPMVCLTVSRLTVQLNSFVDAIRLTLPTNIGTNEY